MTVRESILEFCRLQNRVKLFLALVQTGISGVELSLPLAKYKKRYGKLGGMFWD
jgi:hypothetical protein